MGLGVRGILIRGGGEDIGTAKVGAIFLGDDRPAHELRDREEL